MQLGGESETLGKAIYQVLTKPSLFLFPKSEWQEAQEYLFRQNEEREG